MGYLNAWHWPRCWRHKCENVEHPKRIHSTPLLEEEGKVKASHQRKRPVINWWKLEGAGDQRVLNGLWTTRLSCGGIIWLLDHPPLPSAACIAFSVFLRFIYWRERGGRGGRGAKSWGGEKTWSSINHQYSLMERILSGRATLIATIELVWLCIYDCIQYITNQRFKLESKDDLSCMLFVTL